MSTDKKTNDVEDEMSNLTDELKRIKRDIADAISVFKKALEMNDNKLAIQEGENKIRLLTEFLEKSHDDSIIKLSILAKSDPELMEKLKMYKQIIGYVDLNKRKIQ